MSDLFINNPNILNCQDNELLNELLRDQEFILHLSTEGLEALAYLISKINTNEIDKSTIQGTGSLLLILSEIMKTSISDLHNINHQKRILLKTSNFQ